jgi:hypothetical protein
MLDEVTLPIARCLLNAPPKPHEKMKLHKPRQKSKPTKQKQEFRR